MSNIEKEPQEIYEETVENISEQRQIRREKLLKLQNEGRNPFLTEKWDVDAYSQEIKGGFDDFDGKEVSCAGRIMANRHMGKAFFIDIKDKLERIQCYIRQDEITPEEYEVFKTYDIGDIVGVKGSVFKTRHGEISIRVSDIALLSKSLQVLPDKFKGLKDQDLRYRQRYVDLIVNDDVADTFRKRAAIIKEIRRYLEDDRGFLDVDTPVLTTIAGGANARPFNTHHKWMAIQGLRGDTEGIGKNILCFPFSSMTVSRNASWPQRSIKVATDGETCLMHLPLRFEVRPKGLFLVKPA